MSTLTNLDIIGAVSFEYGDITAIVRSLYLQYIQNNPDDTTNKWTTYVPVIGGQGIISWRVEYPFGNNYNDTAFGVSAVQTQLCTFDLDSATVINYDPSALQGSPMNAASSFFVSSLWWGSVNLTPTPEAVASSIIKGNYQVDVNKLINGQTPPSLPGRNIVFMVYGYIVSRPQVAPQLLLGYWSSQSIGQFGVPAQPPPTLRLLGACYGDVDVTDAVRGLITFQQTVLVNMAKLDRQLLQSPVTGPVPAQRTLSILWQYADEDVQCFSTNATTGLLSIQRSSQPIATRWLVRRPRAGEPNVLAIVWGDGSQTVSGQSLPLSECFNDKVFSSGTFTPSIDWFVNVADPNPTIQQKSCHLYYRYGLTGDVVVAAVYAGSPITIRDQNTNFIDPQPAKGLLRPDDPVPGFTAMTGSGQVLTLVKSNDTYNTYRLKSVDPGTADIKPAYFQFVRKNTSPNSPFPMLSVYVPDEGQFGYLGLPPGQAWRGDTPLPVTFMVPGQNGVSSDPTAYALAFNYEIPARNDKTGLLFAATLYGTTAYYSAVQLMLEASDGSINLVLNQLGLRQLSSVVFVPQFQSYPNSEPTSSIANSETASQTTDAVASEDILDGCLMKTLSVIKVFVWDLPLVVLDVKGLDLPVFKWHKALGKWWSKLPAASRALILLSLKTVQGALHEGVRNAQAFGTKDYFDQFCLITVSLYQSDCLWSLLKALVGGWNWVTFGKIVFNVVEFALEVVNPASIAVKVVKYALQLGIWVVSSAITVTNWVRDCVLHAGQPAVALVHLMGQVARSPQVLALPFRQQALLVNALSAPILFKMMSSPQATKKTTSAVTADQTGLDTDDGALHPLVAFKNAHASPAGLQPEHVNSPFLQLYQALIPNAVEVARQFAPQFQTLPNN